MGRVVCIANQKGGVGKTTTSINLSASLAIVGHRVLLIDLDPQANATSGLGVRDLENRPSTYDLLMGEKPVAEIVAATSQEGLEILPAQRDLVGAEVELVQALAREHRLTDALKPVRDDYDIIIVDCPPSLGLLTINGLTAADGVLIPLQCEYYALEGLSALMDTVRLIRDRLNPNLAIEGILLTMFDTRNSLSHQVAAEVREHFSSNVFETTIPRNVRLSESPSHGIPVAQYDPDSKGAHAYLQLAHELLPGPKGSPVIVGSAVANDDPDDPDGDAQIVENKEDTEEIKTGPIGTYSASEGASPTASGEQPDGDSFAGNSTPISAEMGGDEATTPTVTASEPVPAANPPDLPNRVADHRAADGAEDFDREPTTPDGKELAPASGETDDTHSAAEDNVTPEPAPEPTYVAAGSPSDEDADPEREAGNAGGADDAQQEPESDTVQTSSSYPTTEVTRHGITQEGLGEGARGLDSPGQAASETAQQDPSDSSDRGDIT